MADRDRDRERVAGRDASGAHPALRVLGWVALIILVPSLLYLAHVFDHQRRIERRNLRLLSQAATRVERVLEKTLETLRYQAEHRGSIREFEQRQPYLEFADPEAAETACPDDAACTFKRPATAKQRQDRFTVDSTHRMGHRHLHISVAFEPKSDGGEPAAGDDADAADHSEQISFEIDVQRILDQLPFHHPPWPFDYLVVAVGPEGRVLLQEELRSLGEGRSGMRLESLSKLRVRPTGDDEDESERALVPQVFFASTHRRVELAHEELHLLCQPLRIPVGEEKGTPRQAGGPDGEAGTQGDELADSGSGAICGLVASDRLIRESLAVAPWLAMLLLLVVAYVLLAWPFIKLLFMDRRERFRLRDAYLLLLGTGGCILLAVLLLTDGGSYLALDQRVDTRLQELAAQVETTLGEETSRLSVVLDHLDRELGEKPRDGCTPWRKDSAVSCRLPLPAGAAPVTTVLWIDGKGGQFARARIVPSQAQATVTRLDPRLDVSGRGYFKAAATAPGAFVDTILSITTGEPEVVVARASRLHETADLPGAVVALTAEPPALMRPLLPAGFAFAVIDDQGRARFHSDPAHVGHDLFDELAKGPRLRSAMLARSAVSFASFYKARPHRVFARPLRTPMAPEGAPQPLGASPWWVVAFYDLEVVRTANIESVAWAALASLALACIYGLGFAVLALRFRHARWCWPDPRRIALYGRLTRTCGILAGLLLLGSLVPLPEWAARVALAIFLLLPPAVVVWALLAFRADDRIASGRNAAATPPRPVDSRLCFLAYRKAALLLWIVVAVLPALGIFRWSCQSQMDRVTQLEGLHLLEQIRERSAMYGDTTAQSLGRADALIATLEPYQDQGALGVQIRPSRGWPVEGPDRAAGISSYLPIYNATAQRLRYLSDRPAADGSFRWTFELDRLRLDAEVSPRLGDALGGDAGRWSFVGIALERQRWGGWRSWIVWLPGLALLVAALHYWIGWAGRKLFFANLPPPQRQPLRIADLKMAAVSVIAEVADPRDRRWLFTDPAFDRLSLRGDDLEQRLDESVLPRGDRGKPIVCSYFESGIADPEIRRWKLEQLETLVYDLGRRVILPLSWSPFEVLLKWTPKPDEADRASAPSGLGRMTAASASALRLDPEEVGRWGRVLAEFEVWPLVLEEKRALFERSEYTEVMLAQIARHEGFYWSVWNACSADEKLVLVHLVQESIVNPKQASVVRRLLRRGLVRREPDLRPWTEEFGRFIRRVHTPEEITSWERQFRGLGWRQLRWAFIGLVLLIGVFLFATQPGLFDATLGYVSALTVGVLPVLFRLLGSVQRAPGR